MPELTVLMAPESAYGPTNNCIGIADVLAERGHRVVFAAERSWAGKLAALGFDEALVDLAEPTADEQDAGGFWKDFIRTTAPEFRKPTIEQLETFIASTYRALIDGAIYCEPQLREIVARERPDVIVEDNVITFPALMTSPAPFVRIVSCNPLELRGDHVAPTFSGLPAEDRSHWAEFWTEFDRTQRPLWQEFDAFVRQQGAPPLPELEFIHSSQTLNLYLYPAELDYESLRPLDATWHRLDSSVRRTDAPFTPPELLSERRRPGAAIVYLSLGSLGAADVELMRRLIATLADTPHRYIVSMGPCHAELELADNMCGAEFLPQTSLLAQVDLVITHGGNNTVCEAMHFGKPMIVLPLFWDQYDNAQRIAETGFGVRLPTYKFTADELRGAIDRLLGDAELARRLAASSERIRAADGVRRAAALIERAAQSGAAPRPAD